MLPILPYSEAIQQNPELHSIWIRRLPLAVLSRIVPCPSSTVTLAPLESAALERNYSQEEHYTRRLHARESKEEMKYDGEKRDGSRRCCCCCQGSGNGKVEEQLLHSTSGIPRRG